MSNLHSKGVAANNGDLRGVLPTGTRDASASDIPELELGSGLSSVEAGLRLRYEFRKELAPYVGVEWSRALGDTADYIKARGGEIDDTRFVVGLNAWF